MNPLEAGCVGKGGLFCQVALGHLFGGRFVGPEFAYPPFGGVIRAADIGCLIPCTIIILGDKIIPQRIFFDFDPSTPLDLGPTF